MRVRFDQKYDHTFASRAMVHYPAGWEGTVTREVGAGGIAAGKAVDITNETPGDDALPNNMPKLKGIAKAEGVDLTGIQKVDDIKSAILAKRAVAPVETLPGNLPADLAEPQALTPNLHTQGNSD